MWHHHHADYKDVLFAKQLLFSLEQTGKKVFSDFTTCWHFDDKIGQKYLLESIGAPLASSYVFYKKKEALEWANSTTFPKVFKLRGGAGSSNVQLVKNKSEALRLIKKAFGQGFPQFDRWAYLKEQIRKIKIGNETFLIGILKGFGRLVISTPYARMKGREKGYVYFQEFIPNNDSDIRVIVVDEKAFAIKRMARANDFRASGSGLIRYEMEAIDIRCLKIAFNISDKLKLQCMAYDFVFDEEQKPRILEISYGFSPHGYINCPGYWDKSLNFHKGEFNPYGWMVESVITDVTNFNK
jgi:glutathione synthase/RimK-type ligase-like ATP-grasp enzyme